MATLSHEGVADFYGEHLGGTGLSARSAFEDPREPATGAYRVVRGGAFFFEPIDLRTAARSAAWPSVQAHRMIGFRLVREPEVGGTLRADAYAGTVASAEFGRVFPNS